MKHLPVLITCIFFMVSSLHAQVQGCTDPQAANFQPSATLNNGTCTYTIQNYVPVNPVNLPAALVELSGMVYWNGNFWGHNDGGNGPWLYAFDTLNGSVKKVIGLNGATNIDWEDIAQDSLNLFIGDFGNNANGNRANLRVYIVPKSVLQQPGDTVLLNAGSYGIIQYNYPDQTDFSPTGANNSRFDCEAMFFHRGRLHLFTKNWIGNFSVHYSIPPVAGNFTATRHDSLNTSGFMITGADIGAEDQLMLTAYTRTGSCALFLVYGFGAGNGYFESGNKRRINLPAATQTGQLESVCFINGVRGVIGSEKFQVSVFNVNQQFMPFTTYQWVIDHYKHNPVHFAETGMIRFNTEIQKFEFFDGVSWQSLKYGD